MHWAEEETLTVKRCFLVRSGWMVCPQVGLCASPYSCEAHPFSDGFALLSVSTVKSCLRDHVSHNVCKWLH